MKIASFKDNSINYNKTAASRRVSPMFNKNVSRLAQADTVSFSGNILPAGAYKETKALYNTALELLKGALEKTKKIEFNGKVFSNNVKEQHISSPVMKTAKGEDCWLEYAPSQPYLKYYAGPLHIGYKENQNVTAVIRQSGKNGKTEYYSVFPDEIKEANLSSGKLTYDKKDCLTFNHSTKGFNVSGTWYLKAEDEGKEMGSYYTNCVNVFKEVTQSFIDLMNKK